jgi:ribosomal protein S18 acetylase RimI-like enzyme
MRDASIRISPVETVAQIAKVAGLFQDYAASLPVNLEYQDFATELAGLPGKYASPHGALLIAENDAGEALACGALRGMPEAGRCEMKRLYVAPRGRGLGLGRAMAEAICAEAARLGYREICLDTLPTMTEAQSLYARLGFVEIAPYYDTPVTGTRFLARAV